LQSNISELSKPDYLYIICAPSVHYLCTICAIYAQQLHKKCTDSDQMITL